MVLRPVPTGGSGQDFPGSSGDRERGKFRESKTPRLTAVAVVGDDGEPTTRTLEQILDELLTYQKATVLALSLLTEGETFTVDELLTEVG